MAAAIVLAAPRSVAAADTDKVVLRNGDVIRGEVKSLDKGRLQLSTTSMSTVYVEWDKVVELTAVGVFEFETTDGSRYVAGLSAVVPGKLGLTLDDGRTVLVDVWSVVRMRPIKSVWWRRLSGDVSLGASYTQSSGVGQGTVSSNVKFRRPAFEITGSFDSTVSLENKQVSSARTSARTVYSQLLRNRWFVPALARFERNPELGYNLRSTVGGGVGRFVLQSNRGSLGLGGGVTYNRELPVDGEGFNIVEGFVAATGSFYRYDSPKTNLTVNVSGFPSFSDAGRFRLELDSSITHELIRDFTVGLTVYDSYDSRPHNADALKNDVGMSLTIGWVF